jgi:hypothetical protein
VNATQHGHVPPSHSCQAVFLFIKEIEMQGLVQNWMAIVCIDPLYGKKFSCASFEVPEV